MLNAYLWRFSIPHSLYYAIVKPLWFLIHGTEPLLTTAHLLVFIASYSEQVYHLPRHFLAFVVPSLSYLDCYCPSYGSHCLIQATITSLWVIIALSWLFVMLAVITDDLSRWFLIAFVDRGIWFLLPLCMHNLVFSLLSWNTVFNIGLDVGTWWSSNLFHYEFRYSQQSSYGFLLFLLCLRCFVCSSLSIE